MKYKEIFDRGWKARLARKTVWAGWWAAYAYQYYGLMN